MRSLHRLLNKSINSCLVLAVQAEVDILTIEDWLLGISRLRQAFIDYEPFNAGSAPGMILSAKALR